MASKQKGGFYLGAVSGGAVAGGLALARRVRGLAAHHARRREHAARAARRVLVAGDTTHRFIFFVGKVLRFNFFFFVSMYLGLFLILLCHCTYYYI